MAESQRLAPFYSTAMIEQYATAFGLDPDFVWQKETDDIVIFLRMWKERSEYNDRFRAIDRAMNEVNK